MLIIYKTKDVKKLWLLYFLNKSFHVRYYYATWHFSYADISSNNNHLLSHEKKNIIKNEKKKENTKNMGGLNQNSYVNKNDTYVDYIYS